MEKPFERSFRFPVESLAKLMHKYRHDRPLTLFQIGQAAFELRALTIVDGAWVEGPTEGRLEIWQVAEGYSRLDGKCFTDEADYFMRRMAHLIRKADPLRDMGEIPGAKPFSKAVKSDDTPARPKTPKQIEIDKRQELVKGLYKQGMKDDEIADELANLGIKHCSQETVRRDLEKLGFTEKRPKGRPRLSKKMSKK